MTPYSPKLPRRHSYEGEEHLRRVRRICSALPQTTEKLSHGEPTFFVRKKVYTMFANNHHSDGHVAVWIPAAPGVQEMLIKNDPSYNEQWPRALVPYERIYGLKEPRRREPLAA